MISMTDCHFHRGLLLLDGGDKLVRVGMMSCDSSVKFVYSIVGARFFCVDIPHSQPCPATSSCSIPEGDLPEDLPCECRAYNNGRRDIPM